MSLPKKPKKTTNRPGLSQIAYRIGDYNSFRERLLSDLAYYLPELKTRDPQDFAIALVDAWAVVADVLSFYQERIANEGYLLTATERRSVLELARAIGYELNPGVAASTYLAFIVEDTPDTPREVIVPQEAQVMSVPNEGELPQIFESSKEIVARVDWNRLTPRQGRPHQITNNTQQLYLEGIATQLQPGESILLLDREDIEVAKYLRILTDVIAIPEAGHTLVTWEQPLKLDAPLRQPQVFALRQQGALFGNLAPNWLQDVPDEIKRTANATLKGGVFGTKNQGDRWFPLNRGLPNADILCLVVNQSNDFFVGTPGLGIFRSRDEGATWTQIVAGLTNLTVSTLYVDWERGYILAGTPGGGVFRSTNNGENWSSIGDGTIRVETSGEGDDNSVETVNTGLPDTVINSLVTCSSPIEQDIGTISESTGTKLKVPNVPNVTTLTATAKLRVGDIITIADGQARTVTNIDTVNSDTFLIVDSAFRPSLSDGTAFSIGGTYLFAGTEEGVYRTQDRGKNWYLKGLSNRVVRALIVSYRTTNQGIGTITSEDTTVTGDETKFLAELQVGDKIFANDQIKIIIAIASDTELTIETAFSSALESAKYNTLLHISQGQGTISSENTTVTGVGTNFKKEFQNGDSIVAGGQARTIETVPDETVPEDNQLTTDTAFDPPLPVGTVFFVPKRSQGTISNTGITVTGNGTKFLTESQIGDSIIADDQIKTITAIASDRELTINTAFRNNLSNSTPYWILPVGRTHVFAGTDDGIFHSSDYGETWNEVNNGLSNKNVTSLATDFRVGTGRISSENNTVRGIGTTFIKELKPGDTIVAAGQTRIITSINRETELTVDTAFAPVLPVGTTFAIANRTDLFAGTADGGIFRSRNNGNTWQSVNIDLNNLQITSLVANASLGTGTITSNGNQVNGNGTLFARELRVGDSITALGQTRIVTGIDADNPNTELSIHRVFSPALPTAETKFTINNLFAGTVDGGVFRSVDDGDRWSEINGDIAVISPTRGLATPEITALAIAKPGSLLAGTRFSGFVEQEWPGFQLAPHKIDLDTLYTGILEDSWLVLVDGDRFEALQSDRVCDGSRRDFLLDTTITSIIPTAPITTPSNFNLRTTNVLLQSEQLAMAQESLDVTSQQTKIFLDPISDKSIYLSEFVRGLENGQSLIITGKHPRAKVKLGGIARSQNWNETNAKLGEGTIQALSIIPEGYLLVGTDRGVNIFSSPDRGLTWNSLSQGLSNQNVTSFVTSREEGIGTIVGNGTEIIGQRNTEFFNQLQTGDSIAVGGQNRTVTNILDKTKLSIDNAFNVSLNGNLPFTIHKLFAGTDRGIFRFCADTLKWEQVNQQELPNIQTLAIKQADNSIQLFAGTQKNGVLRSDDYGRNWTKINQGLTDQNITTLLVNPGCGQIFAGTASKRIFRSTDNGNSWQQIAFTKPGTGTIASNGTEVSGNRTAFGRELKAGDLIIVAGQTRVVTSFNSETPDLVLNINTAFIPDLPPRTTFDISTGLTDMKLSQLEIYRQLQTVTISSNGITVTGTGTSFLCSLSAGDIIIANNQIRTVNQIVSDTQLTLDRPFSGCDRPVAIFTLYLLIQSYFYRLGLLFLQLCLYKLFSTDDFLTPNRSRGTISSDRTIIRGKNTVFTKELRVGDKIIVAAQKRTVTSITSDVVCTIDTAFEPNITSLNSPTQFQIEREGESNQSTISGTIFDAIVIGAETNFTAELRAEDVIIAAGQIKIVEAVLSATEIAVNTFFETDLSEGTPYFVPCQGQGTISSIDTTVTGDENTIFTTELQKNDVIVVVGEIRTVNGFNLTIDAEFEENLPPQTVFFMPPQAKGTIQSQGTTVTGDEATAFTTDLEVGDIIIAANQIKTVATIDSQTGSLTIDAEFEADLPPQTVFFTVPRAKGTIQSEGTTVTGDEATAFTTDLEVGDIIIAANQIRTVAAIDSQTRSLTIDAEFEADLPPQTVFFTVPRAKGTIQSEGTTVTGDEATAFTTDLEVGDIIIAANQITTVAALNLLIDTAFDQGNLSNKPFSFFSQTTLIAATVNGGVFRSSNNGEHWEAVNTGLTNLEIRSLAVHPHNGYLFAGTTNGSLFRSTNLGNNWHPIDAGLSSQSVGGIAIANDDNPLLKDILFTGIGNKVFRSRNYGRNWTDIHWQRINRGLTALTVQAIAVHRESERLYLFVGTREGVFSSRDGGEHWQPINEGLTSLDVGALLACSSSLQLYAGTKEGLFLSTDYGELWTAVDIGIAQAEIRALASNPITKVLFAATFSDGVIRYSPDSERWIPLGLTDAFLQAMTINPANGDIYIGTTSRGIFYSSNQGNSWQQLTKTRSGTGKIISDGVNLTGEDTKFALELRVGDEISVAGQKRTVVTISLDNPNTSITIDRPFSPDLRSGKNFTLHTGLTNLNVTALAVYPLPGTGAITIEGVKVTGIGTDFNRELTVGDTITVINQTKTVIKIDPDKEELILDRELIADITEATPFSRDIILAGTAGSGVFRSTNQGKRWEEVNTGLNNLEIRCLTVDKYSNRILVGTTLGGVFDSSDLGDLWQPLHRGLTNTDIQTIAIDSTNIFVGGIGILLSQDGFAAVEVQPDDWLYVIRPPEAASPGQKWQVRNLDNFIGSLITLKDDDITLYPAIDEDQTLSELGIINIPPNNQQLPQLTLEKHLTNSYDPATVTIYGNIVEATHGETVSEEVLGSGDSAIANQRFELQKPPLTYISVPTVSGIASTLTVYVNDVAWERASSLYVLDKLAPGYIIRIEDDGTTKVIFGDGEHGLRLPSGQENVVAYYRSGIGVQGNIDAETLTLLKTRPLGIEEVTNPLPATGGAERENLAEARTNAPLTIRTLDRIVSLQDFEDFARTFAGISKAQAIPLWTGDSQIVHITVAAANGDPVPIDSALYNNLVDAIDIARDTLQQVQVDSYEAIAFNLEAQVLLNPSYLPERVITAVREVLQTQFSFDQRELGQAVTASEIIATIQKVAGVTAVDLDTLYRRGLSKILNQSLVAQKARWNSETNQANPAQLLFLDADSITLSTNSKL